MLYMSSYHCNEDLSSLHVAYSYLLQYLNISNHDVNDCRCVVVIWTVCYTRLLSDSRGRLPNMAFLRMCNLNICNLAFTCGRIAKISSYYRKSWSGNTMVMSDVISKVEIWPFRACAIRNIQFGHHLWPNPLNSYICVCLCLCLYSLYIVCLSFYQWHEYSCLYFPDGVKFLCK